MKNEFPDIANSLQVIAITCDLYPAADTSTPLGQGIRTAIEQKKSGREIIRQLQIIAKKNAPHISLVIGPELTDRILNFEI